MYTVEHDVGCGRHKAGIKVHHAHLKEIFVYKKALILTFNNSYLTKNNLCEFLNTHPQIQKGYFVVKTRFQKVVLKISDKQ